MRTSNLIKCKRIINKKVTALRLHLINYLEKVIDLRLHLIQL